MTTHAYFRLLADRAVPLARWALVWWLPAFIALFLKREMMGHDSLAITAGALGRPVIFKRGAVDPMATFSVLEQLSFYRGDLLWGFLLLSMFSLLLTSARMASRWRGTILAAASILLSCLLYLELRSVRVVGRMLSRSLTADALAFANCCMPTAEYYSGSRESSS